MHDVFEKDVPYILEKKRELRFLNKMWGKILCCFLIFMAIYTIKLINNESSNKVMVVIQQQYSADYQNQVEAVFKLKSTGSAESVFKKNEGKPGAMSIILPVNGKIITYGKFENHPINGYALNKPGVDIIVVMHSSVIACYDGTVVETGYNKIYGNYVILNHDLNIYSLYAFLDEINVATGKQCQRGSILGAVRTNSYVPTKLVRFELWINGTGVNPVSMLG